MAEKKERLELEEEDRVNENKVQELMKKHPPWFMFDIHPIRFTKSFV